MKLTIVTLVTGERFEVNCSASRLQRDVNEVVANIRPMGGMIKPAVQTLRCKSIDATIDDPYVRRLVNLNYVAVIDEVERQQPNVDLREAQRSAPV